MVGLIAMFFCAGLSALNVFMYAWTGQPISLAAAVFCGILAIVNGMMAVSR